MHASLKKGRTRTPLVTANETCLSDVYDGSIATKCPAFLDRHCLQLLLYHDDFEVANHLGTKRGVQKRLAAYFTVLNMQLKCRSKLENLLIVLLVRSSCVTKYSLQFIMTPLLNELIDSQSAATDVSVDGSQHHFTGRIALVCGDNLAAKPFCVHIDKVKLYESEEMPPSWLLEPISDDEDQRDVAPGTVTQRNQTVLDQPEEGALVVSNSGPSATAGTFSYTEDPAIRPSRHVGHPQHYLE